MNQISKSILDTYQARKTKKQKEEFINFLTKSLLKHTIKPEIEEGGVLHSKNIIIGNVEKAKLILTAHYDTAPKRLLPMPTIITPTNVPLYFAILMIPMFLYASALRYLFVFLNVPSLLTGLLIFFILLACMFLGFTNKNTANDNTSGVISLIELICRSDINFDKVAFVLFDHEEIGLRGSSFFAKKYKSILGDKLVINLDCVSDGDHIMVMKGKNIAKNDELHVILKNAFENVPKDKYLYIEDKCFYPSDNMNFKNNIAIASCNQSKIFGKTISKIHTPKDTVFDSINIDYITNSLVKVINYYDSQRIL